MASRSASKVGSKKDDLKRSRNAERVSMAPACPVLRLGVVFMGKMDLRQRPSLMQFVYLAVPCQRRPRQNECQAENAAGCSRCDRPHRHRRDDEPMKIAVACGRQHARSHRAFRTAGVGGSKRSDCTSYNRLARNRFFSLMRIEQDRTRGVDLRNVPCASRRRNVSRAPPRRVSLRSDVRHCPRAQQMLERALSPAT